MSSRRPPRSPLIVATVLALLLAVVRDGSGVPAVATPRAGARASLRVGSMTLKRCAYQAGAWCGWLPQPLDPTDPRGARLRIGVVWYPASGPGAAVGTIVANEGGPGWPSTGSSAEYRRLFRPLLATRNLLLIANRGTGRSDAIDCPALQQHPYPASGRAFERLVGACGRSLNHTWRGSDGRWVHASDLFATPYAVRDAAHVMRALDVGKVDMYGDSYGTWFVRSFVSRHPDMLRSVVLDSSYPMFAGGPWYASSFWTARASMRLVCLRDAACAAVGGDPWERLSQLVDRVRAAPMDGATRDPSSGARERITVDVRTLVDVAANAGFDPIVYRELDAAVRAALDGDPAPLLRLAALAAHVDNLPPRLVSWYSDGLYFAASCTDYAQLYDMGARPSKRRAQIHAVIARTAADRFAPFLPGEWAQMDNYSETYTGCLDWPRPIPAHVVTSAGHAAPLAPPDLPVLMVSGELDSWTSPRMAPQMLAEMGPSARFVQLANSVHTASEGDVPSFTSTACGSAIIRSFMARPDRLSTLDTSCADAVPSVHTPGAFPAFLADATAAVVVSGEASDAERRAATVAAQALGDTLMDWYVAHGSSGWGLRGGRFTGHRGSAGSVRLRLHGVRWVTDAAVSGRATWRLWTGAVRGTLRVRVSGGTVVGLNVTWNANEPTATVRVAGGAVLELPAP